MRQILAATTVALVALGAASSALAQADRYGGVGSYPAPAQAAQGPARVLTWQGKQVPASSPPQYGGYGYPRYVQAQPAYGQQLQPAPYAQSRGAPPPPYAVERRMAMYPQPQPAYAYPPAQYAPQYPPQGQPQYQYPVQPYPPQQAYPQPQPQMAPPRQGPAAQPMPPQGPAPQATFTQPFQPQPFFAPAPGAPPTAPGSTATAPAGVYPPNTVPPQLASPMAVPPQAAQPLVTNPQLPTSIYAPAPQAMQQLPAPQPTEGVANPTDPRQPQRVAMMDAAAPTARYYSLHRQFGLTPDPTPAPAAEGTDSVELVSSINSGVGAEPDAAPRNRVIQTKGKNGTAILRGARDDDPDAN